MVDFFRGFGAKLSSVLNFRHEMGTFVKQCDTIATRFHPDFNQLILIYMYIVFDLNDFR